MSRSTDQFSTSTCAISFYHVDNFLAGLPAHIAQLADHLLEGWDFQGGRSSASGGGTFRVQHRPDRGSLDFIAWRPALFG